ncbi:VanZ family protein [Romboutsia sp. 1001713B170207_170306_H8]|uniref:VanZ family protein n=1 Tax=Romboutsia sp. 1001713B170207_170306_H8 TaxID=2787112 RepID=UPI0018980AA7|nr:VanZ family protein [Romboutsia sp. 1001713B170207_170306_H8]
MWLEKSLFTFLISIILYSVLFIYLKKSKYNFKKIFYITLLYFYGVIVFHITILPLPLDKIGVESLQLASYNNYYLNLIPFNDFIKMDKFSFIKQVIGNIVMFIPLGFLLPLSFEKCKDIKILIKYSFLTSLLIELSQLIICLLWIRAPYRVFDINDLLLNLLGSLLGYILYCNILKVILKGE